MNKKWESIKNDGYWNSYSDFYNEIEIYKAENKQLQFIYSTKQFARIDIVTYTIINQNKKKFV